MFFVHEAQLVDSDEHGDSVAAAPAVVRKEARPEGGHAAGLGDGTDGLEGAGVRQLARLGVRFLVAE
eukprot:scaffold4386_cov105-Isochrysis_galbana.AAC.1